MRCTQQGVRAYIVSRKPATFFLPVSPFASLNSGPARVRAFHLEKDFSQSASLQYADPFLAHHTSDVRMLAVAVSGRPISQIALVMSWNIIP